MDKTVIVMEILWVQVYSSVLQKNIYFRKLDHRESLNTLSALKAITSHSCVLYINLHSTTITITGKNYFEYYVGQIRNPCLLQ